MNRITFALLTVVSAACLWADGVAIEGMPAKKRAKLEALAAKNGGIVQKEYSGKFIRLVSTQSQVSMEEIEAVAYDVQRSLRAPVKVSLLPKEADNLTLIEKCFMLEDTAAVVAIVDGQRGPALLTAPESAWAIVNVDVLAKDKPDHDKLARRVRQEIWRGLVFSLNGTDSQMQPCLMTIVKSVGNLDRNKMIVPSPEPIFKMFDGMTARGINQIRSASYRRACQEGWAPSPTNDIQKAIWDEVHSTPEKPIKIKFDPKKNK